MNMGKLIKNVCIFFSFLLLNFCQNINAAGTNNCNDYSFGVTDAGDTLIDKAIICSAADLSKHNPNNDPNGWKTINYCGGANYQTCNGYLPGLYSLPHKPHKPSKANGLPQMASCTRNPINTTSGNKYQSETDYSFGGYSNLDINRSYNSSFTLADTHFGSNWINYYNRSIRPLLSSTEVNIRRHDGKILYSKLISTNWLSDADINDKLIELKNDDGVRTGWMYTVDATGEIETYDTIGKLLSITDRAGLTQTLTYDTSSRLVSVVDSFGRSLHYAYDASNRTTNMTNPAGGVYFYTYDSNNNLSSVTYPDTKSKIYHYENTTFVNALTGITDENNNRFSTYAYDSSGRAISSEHAGAVEKSTLAYYTNGSGNPTNTVVTDIGTGAVRTYNLTTILGVLKSTGQSQPAGSGCAASAAAFTYDVNGNVVSRTDFNGNKTTYVYDMARNLETSRTEGLTPAGAVTAATRTITTTWHATWRLPLIVSEYTGAVGTGTPLRSTTTVYDTKGNITSYTEEDPARGLSRNTTTTYTYSSIVPSLVITNVVDGPRTGVNDVTTYTYYDADATCLDSSETPIIDPITNTSPPNLGCRGQLYSVLNGAYIYTYYNRYNHHGQLEEMIDNNSLSTIYSYDLRQRLLSKTTTDNEGSLWLSSSLTYDNAGQVTQLTMEDNSNLNYTYDAAHRLTDIEDSMGNKVHYTLDAEGNRINETTTDPQGSLIKTITRSYDALNRLQQVTGVE